MNRDISVIEHIHRYCCKIEEYLKESLASGLSDEDRKKEFLNNGMLIDAISMNLLAIGELANVLTGDFKENDEYPWKQVIGMRHFLAHTYTKTDPGKIWNTVIHDIPSLKNHCEKHLER